MTKKQYDVHSETNEEHLQTVVAHDLTHFSTGSFYLWMRCRQAGVWNRSTFHFIYQCLLVYVGL